MSSRPTTNSSVFEFSKNQGRNDGSIGELVYTKEDIEKEREYTRKKEKIMMEFKKMDRNADSFISMDEWLRFMQIQVFLSFII